MTKDSYYSDTAARLDTIIGGDTDHFLRLQRVKHEWDDLVKTVPAGQGFLNFYDYIKEHYGIELAYEGNDIQLSYTVIDSKKFTVFLLKFGQ
jgi:hypothetical protein